MRNSGHLLRNSDYAALKARLTRGKYAFGEERLYSRYSRYVVRIAAPLAAFV